MNERIVLISPKETPSFSLFYGIGLGSKIWTLNKLGNLTDSEKEKEILNLSEGDAIMTVGAVPFHYIRDRFHVGLRNETFADAEKLPRLSMEGGAYLKQVNDVPDEETIKYFMSEEFTKKVTFDNFRQGIIHCWKRAMDFLNWIDSLPLDEDLGFDYEGSGMPLDRYYELSGFSISTATLSQFVSLTDIRHELGVVSTEGNTDPKYQELLKRLADILFKRMEHIWTYNMQYEYKVSHRMLGGVDLYNLSDASVVNVVTGNHFNKKYSLKWSGQYYLGVEVWDSEFDRISDLVDKMLFEVIGEKKAEKRKVLRVSKENFKQTEEWKELCTRYPNHVEEFEKLILEYWGNAFMVIPSDILGYYCNLDAFYTLQIYLSQKDNYSKECWNAFMDNARLSVRLGNGLYIDEGFRKRYSDYSQHQMVYGITYCATARCWINMTKYKKGAASLKKYHPVSVKLLKEGNFFGGDTIQILKYLYTSNLDTTETYETGINEGLLVMKFGEEFAQQFIEDTKNVMTEIKFKGKIDETVVRKKKLLGMMSDKLLEILKLDPDNLGTRHNNLEKFLYYESAYNELYKIGNRQLNDINNIPDTILGFGKRWSPSEFAKFLCDEFFKCTSPEENDEIVLEMATLFRYQTSFLAAMFESSQQLPEAQNFYKSRNITDIQQGFDEFMDEWRKYFDGTYVQGETKRGDQILGHDYHSDLYPDKVFNLALENFKGIRRTVDTTKKPTAKGNKYIYYFNTAVKDIWADFNGWSSQADFFGDMVNQYKDYSKPFSPKDFDDTFFFMRKFNLMYLLFKKHNKVESTYVGETGMFKKTLKRVIVDERHIPIREADENEPGAVDKLFIHYEVNTKSSKRWSSPFHTIISHSDLKNAICCPPSYDEQGNIIYGGGDFLMTYFDISSAEVKAAGYASMDPGLIDKFSKGEDIYIYSAQLYLGEEGWNALNGKERKMWRKRFKTIFLGVLYGLGRKSLAERLNCSEDDADHIIQGLYTSFPGLRKYVEGQQRYPLEHDGYIKTFLGDKLQIKEYLEWLKEKNERERKNLEARVQRLGVNLPIQGGTSTVMSSGFFNDIRVSIQEGWSTQLQPIITVHDSNTCLLPTEKIFEIRRFYDKNFTDFCAGFGPKIKLLFDLLSGTAYEAATEMKTIDDNTIEFSGPADSLLRTYDKIMNCPKMVVECSMKREDLIPKYEEDAMLRFIKEKGTCMTMDESKYKIQFKRIS